MFIQENEFEDVCEMVAILSRPECVKHILSNCFQLNATEFDWWQVNIGSSNGLVPSGNNELRVWSGAVFKTDGRPVTHGH